MKNETLMELLSTVDEAHLEEARTTNASAFRASRNKRWGAAGLALTICLVLTGGLLLRNHPKQQRSDFLVENGILLSYSGADTAVTLPEGITAIAANSFAAAERASDITSIQLNTTVSHIDEAAFAGLTSLREVSVPEENRNFQFSQQILKATDESIYFSLTQEGRIDVAGFVETIQTLGTMKEYTEREIKFVFGEAVMTVVSEKLPEQGPAWFQVKKLSAFGQSYEIEKGQYYQADSATDGWIEVNAELHLLLTEDAFVYAKKVMDFGLQVMLTRDGVFEIPNQDTLGQYGTTPPAEAYNASILWLDEDASGRLIYTRQPRKYAFDQSLDAELRYCVGPDEFALEKGLVTVENGEIHYQKQEQFTISQRMDLQSAFESYAPYSGLPEVHTLEELLAYNQEHYQRAQ